MQRVFDRPACGNLLVLRVPAEQRSNGGHDLADAPQVVADDLLLRRRQVRRGLRERRGGGGESGAFDVREVLLHVREDGGQPSLMAVIQAVIDVLRDAHSESRDASAASRRASSAFTVGSPAARLLRA